MDHVHEVERFIFSHQFGFSALPMGWWSNGEDGLTEESLKTMSRYRKITTICCAAVFALGLAACGGGDDGISTSERDAAVADAVAKERAMLQARIDVLEERLGIEGENDPGDDVADLQAQIDDLEGQLKDKQDAEAEAADMANRAKLNKLAMVIGAVDPNALEAHIRSADTNMRAKPKDAMDGNAPHAISGWNGSSYSTKTVTTVVYNDKAADAPSPFNKRFTVIAAGAENAGTVALEMADHGKLVGGISGLPTHPSHDGVNVGVTNGVRGTLAGAAGTFLGVSGPAVVGLDADGDLTWTGTLHFKPDSATATVMMPDTTYTNLGWWLTEDENGIIDVQVAAWAEGTPYAHGTKLAALIGKAAFEGIAVGKYTHKTINSINGGHFNADATLVMDFADGSDAGTLRGTIDNFMQDGESIGDGWKVELGLAAASDPPTFNPMMGAAIANGEVDDTENGALGTFGNQKTMGTWNAMLVDNTRNDGMPGGVTGQFHIGEASHPINMVGAFAASNMEADQPKK